MCFSKKKDRRERRKYERQLEKQKYTIKSRKSSNEKIIIADDITNKYIPKNRYKLPI